MPLALEAKLFGVILAIVLLCAGLVLSFHEGQQYQENKDKIVWQAKIDAAQKAVDEANQRAIDIEHQMNASVALAEEKYTNDIESLKADDAKRIASLNSGLVKLRVAVNSCSQPLPSTTATSGVSNGPEVAVVTDDAARRLDALIAEHNEVVAELAEAQAVIEADRGVPKIPTVIPN
jgi:hypothetical protein